MQTISDAIDAARLLRACRALHARWRQMREGRDGWKSAAQWMSRRLAEAQARAGQAQAAFAARVDSLEAERDLYLAQAREAQVERDRLAAELDLWIKAQNNAAHASARHESDRDRLAAENEQLVATVNAAMRDHAACEAERARLQREVEALTAERGLARRRADDLARDLERVADERDRGREALARPLPPVVVSLLTTAGTGDSYCACGRRVSDCDGSRAACGGRR